MLPDSANGAPFSPWPAPPICAQPIRPGIALCWGAECSAGALGAQASVAAASVLFSFVLGGDCSRGDDWMALLHPQSLAACARAGPFGVFHVTIALDHSALHELLSCDNTLGAAQVRESAADPVAPAVTFPLTPAARLAVESIRRCPFVGACRTMALAARCNDLLVEFLTTISVTTSPRPVARTRSMEEQIRSAAGRLAHHLETPPTLAALAREVGLSETTLKRGFRQVFNTTVFGYIRARRMERAHEALQSGEATVLEAAALVGYSNPSNFAAAFRRQFGVNPKKFQLAVRR